VAVAEWRLAPALEMQEGCRCRWDWDSEQVEDAI
jgi:hypothetical protein